MEFNDYILRINNLRARGGGSIKKRRWDNDVDIVNNVMNETTITNTLVVDKATKKVAKVNYEFSYWTSLEARTLFGPNEGRPTC